MKDVEQTREEERLQSRRKALVKLGLAATVAYAVPMVASVKVYAGQTVSPSKHGVNNQPGKGVGGSTGAPGKGK
jgi:hypothetical protein